MFFIYALHEVLIIVHNCYRLLVLAATLIYFCWKYAHCDRKRLYLIKCYYYVDHMFICTSYLIYLMELSRIRDPKKLKVWRTSFVSFTWSYMAVITSFIIGYWYYRPVQQTLKDMWLFKWQTRTTCWHSQVNQSVQDLIPDRSTAAQDWDICSGSFS